MRKVKTIMLDIDACECDTDEDMDKLDILLDELRKVDPYNDMFHFGCTNWPNCDMVGCGGEL